MAAGEGDDVGACMVQQVRLGDNATKSGEDNAEGTLPSKGHCPADGSWPGLTGVQGTPHGMSGMVSDLWPPPTSMVLNGLSNPRAGSLSPDIMTSVNSDDTLNNDYEPCPQRIVLDHS